MTETGISLYEARQRVQAMLERWDDLAELWNSLTVAQERELVETARAMVEGNRDAD
jgi:hypothetical protein